MNNNSFIKSGFENLIQFVEIKSRKTKKLIDDLERVNFENQFDNTIKLDEGMYKGYRIFQICLESRLKDITLSKIEMTTDEQIDMFVSFIDDIPNMINLRSEEERNVENHYIELGISDALSTIKERAYMILGMLYYSHRSTELKYNKEERNEDRKETSSTII